MPKSKIFLKLSTIILTIVPLNVMISCSTSWIKWKKSNEQTSNIINYEELQIAKESKHQIRHNVFQKVYNKSTKIINLNQINNQFEFIEVISQITKLQPKTKNIDQFWNDFNGMNIYINQVEKNTKFKFQYNGNISQEIEWNIKKAVKTIRTGIIDFKKIEKLDNHSTIYSQKIKDLNIAISTGNKVNIDKIQKSLKNDPISQKKQFDIQIKGVTNGQPVDFEGVVNSAIQLLNIPSVKLLLTKDTQLALNLSKLVNLPKISFLGFANLLKNIDTFFDVMLSKNKNKAFYQWSKNINFQIMKTGFINPNQEINHLKILKALFLTKNFKKPNIISSDKGK